MANSDFSPSSSPRSAAKTTLDEFISRLRELQAQGAGELPVLIETRNRRGAVIYGAANARRDTVVRLATGGYRQVGKDLGQQQAVVRIGCWRRPKIDPPMTVVPTEN